MDVEDIEDHRLRTHLHLLSSRPAARDEHRPDPSHGGRSPRSRDRPGVLGVGDGHGTAPRAGSTQDRTRRHPLPSSATRTVGGTAERRSHGVVPGFQDAGYTDVALADVAVSAVSLAEAVVDLMPASPKRVASSHYCCCNRPGASRELSPVWRSAHPRGARPHVVDPFRHRPRRRGAGFCPRRGPVRSPGQDRARVTPPRTCAERTDWSRIVALYDELLRQLPTPVVARSARSLSVCGTGPTRARRVDRISTELDGFHLVQAAQADLLRRAGRTTDAAQRYRQAIALAPTARERGQLELRLATLTT